MILLRRFFLLVFCLGAVRMHADAAEPQSLIVAHRGLLRHAPENTLANFRACLELPTIEEVLKLVAEYGQQDVLVAVDLKVGNVEQDVVRLAEKHNVLHRLLFIGMTISEPRVRQELRRVSPKAQSAAVANNPDEFLQALADDHAAWVYFRFLPSKEQVDAVHAAKKRAFIAGMTVSGHVPDNWGRAVKAGIDGILTDYPLELRGLLRKDRKG